MNLGHVSHLCLDFICIINIRTYAMSSEFNILGTYTVGNGDKEVCLTVFKNYVSCYKADSISEQLGKIDYLDLLDSFTKRSPDEFNFIIDSLDKNRLEVGKLDLCILTEFDSNINKFMSHYEFIRKSTWINSGNYFQNLWLDHIIDMEFIDIDISISKKFLQVISKIDFQVEIIKLLVSLYRLIGTSKTLKFTNPTTRYFIEFYTYRRLNYEF